MKKTIYLIGIAASIMGGITSCTLDAEDYFIKQRFLYYNNKISHKLNIFNAYSEI